MVFFLNPKLSLVTYLYIFVDVIECPIFRLNFMSNLAINISTVKKIRIKPSKKTKQILEFKFIDTSRIEISKEITPSSRHLLDSKWNGLFLIICRNGYVHTQTRLPKLTILTNLLPCELNPFGI